jgi:hypothetical protein
MLFQRRTLAALGRLMPEALSGADLDALFYEFELENRDPRGNKLTRSIAFLQGIEVQYPEGEADRIVDEITLRILSLPFLMVKAREDYEALIYNLRLEGFEFVDGRLRPTTTVPAALAPEISVLENDLNQYGMTTAVVHYTQAVDNFTAGNWEACNGQIRSFMEDLLVTIGERLTRTARTEPLASLQDLQNGNYLDHAEFNQFRSFWSGIQDNGPHHGLSSEQEALFRLHVATSIARYLIFKLSLMER